jgi:four helix bundle protein
MHNFRKLNVWTDSIDFAEQVYIRTGKFPAEEKFNLTSQLRRCAVSIPSNIAEGTGRNKDGELEHFIGIANGSAFELETQLVLANRLGYLQKEEFDELLQKLQSLQKQLYRFKESLTKSK